MVAGNTSEDGNNTSAFPVALALEEHEGADATPSIGSRALGEPELELVSDNTEAVALARTSPLEVVSNTGAVALVCFMPPDNGITAFV